MKAKSTILLLYIAWLIAAVMLVFAAGEKQPDSFYTMLRWVCCAVFVYSAVTSFQMKAHAVAGDFRRVGDCV
jgi:threonine/homoserine/homoserine lactone efflux protein